MGVTQANRAPALRVGKMSDFEKTISAGVIQGRFAMEIGIIFQQCIISQPNVDWVPQIHFKRDLGRGPHLLSPSWASSSS